MIWKMAALTVILVGCTERPLDTPHSPPMPPGADLWPLGGKIYDKLPDQDNQQPNLPIDDTTGEVPADSDTAPADDAPDAEALGEKALDVAEPAAPAEPTTAAEAEPAAEPTAAAPAEAAAEPTTASAAEPATEENP